MLTNTISLNQVEAWDHMHGITDTVCYAWLAGVTPVSRAVVFHNMETRRVHTVGTRLLPLTRQFSYCLLTHHCTPHSHCSAGTGVTTRHFFSLSTSRVGPRFSRALVHSFITHCWLNSARMLPALQTVQAELGLCKNRWFRRTLVRETGAIQTNRQCERAIRQAGQVPVQQSSGRKGGGESSPLANRPGRSLGWLSCLTCFVWRTRITNRRQGGVETYFLPTIWMPEY